MVIDELNWVDKLMRIYFDKIMWQKINKCINENISRQWKITPDGRNVSRSFSYFNRRENTRSVEFHSIFFEFLGNILAWLLLEFNGRYEF